MFPSDDCAMPHNGGYIIAIFDRIDEKIYLSLEVP